MYLQKDGPTFGKCAVIPHFQSFSISYSLFVTKNGQIEHVGVVLESCEQINFKTVKKKIHIKLYTLGYYINECAFWFLTCYY